MFVCIVHSCIQYNTFFADINVFVQTEEPSDFTNIANISFLNPDFVVEESHFQNIPHNSIIILDDFSFKVINKETKQNFLKVCNYILPSLESHENAKVQIGQIDTHPLGNFQM